MAIFEAKKKCGMLGFWYCLFTILIFTGIWNCGCAARFEKEIRERFYGSLLNSSAPDSSDGSIAKMFGSDRSSFNNSVPDQHAVLETLAKITHEKTKKNDTQEANGTRAFQLQDVSSLENEDSDDEETLIDKKDMCL